MFQELRGNFKAWIDDFMIFARDESHLLIILRKFFNICRTRRLVVSLTKSDFFRTDAYCCGRIIYADGIRFNPRNLSGLQDCELPHSAGELCEYVHRISWISASIPRFAERAGPLRAVLEAAYAKAGGTRKKTAISKIPLADTGWSDEHIQAFKGLQIQIQEATILSHRDPDQSLCIHTDASDKHWAI